MKPSSCLSSRAPQIYLFAITSHTHIYTYISIYFNMSIWKRHGKQPWLIMHQHFYNEWGRDPRSPKGQLWTRARWIFSPCPSAAWITWSRQTWTLLQVNNYSCICHKYLAEGAIAKIEIVSPSNCQMARINSEDLKYWCTFSIIDISWSRLSDCILTEHLGWLRN